MTPEQQGEYRRQMAEAVRDDESDADRMLPTGTRLPSWWRGSEHAQQTSLSAIQALQANRASHGG